MCCDVTCVQHPRVVIDLPSPLTPSDDEGVTRPTEHLFRTPEWIRYHFFFFSFDPLKNLSTCFSDFISALSESGYIPRYPFERYATDIPKLYKLYKWNTVASLRRSSCSERWYRWKLARYDWREKNFQPRDLDNISIFFDAFRTGLLRLSRPTFFFRFCLKTWSNSAGTMLLEHLARSSLLRSHVAVNSAYENSNKHVVVLFTSNRSTDCYARDSIVPVVSLDSALLILQRRRYICNQLQWQIFHASLVPSKKQRHIWYFIDA